MPRVTIRRESDQKIQFDTSCLTYQLVGKGTVNVRSRLGGNSNPGSLLIPIPSINDSNRIVAIRASFTTAKAGIAYVDGQPYLHYACDVTSGSADYWAFNSSDSLSPSPGGLTLRNPSNNQIIYSSDYDMFRARDMISGINQSKTLSSDIVWAAAQPDMAAVRTAPTGSFYYINGQFQRWNGSDMPPGTNWAYNNNHKLYGTRFDGSTVYTGPVSWDDVQTNLGNGSRPPAYPPNINRPLNNVLLVDVTNL